MISLGEILQNRKLVLGRNERYLDFIRPFNHKRAIRTADDKIISKKILKKNNIPVPNLIAVINNKRELKNFDFNNLPNSFVLKPVKGVRGGGVEIVYNRDKQERWIKAGGTRVSQKDLVVTIQDILDGKYSLFNEPDRVLIEERVRPHKNFKYYTYKGTPDVRIIVFNHIPIMSYVRLPTKESDGKANLDLGAIGAGIDMSVGKTTTSIIGKSTEIDYVPGTQIPLSGLKIPFWDRILRYAIEASKVTGLGFGAIDFLIDQELGPLIVELNARPGLSIQIANDDGIRWRLKKASGIKVKSTEQGVRLAKDLFGGEIEEEIQNISGKQVIGLIVNAKLYALEGENIEELKAKVDTGADSTSIDREIAIRLGYENLINIPELQNLTIPEELEKRQELERKLTEELKSKYENLSEVQFVRSSSGFTIRPYMTIKLSIEGIEFETKASIIDRSKMSYTVIIGKNSLNKFLIDPTKK